MKPRKKSVGWVPVAGCRWCCSRAIRRAHVREAAKVTTPHIILWFVLKSDREIHSVCPCIFYETAASFQLVWSVECSIAYLLKTDSTRYSTSIKRTKSSVSKSFTMCTNQYKTQRMVSPSLNIDQRLVSLFDVWWGDLARWRVNFVTPRRRVVEMLYFSIRHVSFVVDVVDVSGNYMIMTSSYWIAFVYVLSCYWWGWVGVYRSQWYNHSPAFYVIGALFGGLTIGTSACYFFSRVWSK